mgnify:CR=1 FL=1
MQWPPTSTRVQTITSQTHRALCHQHNDVLSDSIVDSDESADEDLKPILKILCRGGYDVSKTSTTIDRSVLPKWSEILDFYGPPKILGLETCSLFRKNTKQEDRHVAPAGLFNTGTNLLDNLIDDNCDFKNTNVNKKELMTYEVPWGKHIPFSKRKVL